MTNELCKDVGGVSTLELVVRPKVPMYCLEGIPYVCALGISQALGGTILWPYEVLRDNEAPISLSAHGGYDGEGAFVRVHIFTGKNPSIDISAAIYASVIRWENKVNSKAPIIGPLAPLLTEYVEALEAFGKKVEIIFPNGRIATNGIFCGVDVWGHATVQLTNGQKLELAPEQAKLKLLS